MAIQSMTGFGRATVVVDGASHTIEARSVNHRYLDVKTRLPRSLGPLEAAVRRTVADRLQRGRVEVTVTGADEGGASGLRVNHALAAQVRAMHAELAATHGVPDGLDSTGLAAWPGVVERVAQAHSVEALEAAFAPGLEAALDALCGMRAREGAALRATLAAHLDHLDGARAALVAAAPGQVQAYRARLQKRLGDWLASVDVHLDEARVAHEVAVFADKTDVTEELARLEMHLAQARELLASEDGEGVGRRLDFLCQELLREVNTTGSKVQDAGLTETVVGMKAELERLREQVQNVE